MNLPKVWGKIHMPYVQYFVWEWSESKLYREGHQHKQLHPYIDALHGITDANITDATDLLVWHPQKSHRKTKRAKHWQNKDCAKRNTSWVWRQRISHSNSLSAENKMSLNGVEKPVTHRWWNQDLLTLCKFIQGTLWTG